jgi:hypothetical protein
MTAGPRPNASGRAARRRLTSEGALAVAAAELAVEMRVIAEESDRANRANGKPRIAQHSVSPGKALIGREL